MNLKTIFSAGVIGLMVLALASSARAGPISYTDTYTPGSPVYLWSQNTATSFTHNILDEGFDPAGVTLTSANIEIYVIDPSLNQYRVNVNLDGFDVGTYVVGSEALNLTVYVQLLQQDGKLDVVLTRMCGDFWFNKSVLTAEGYAKSEEMCSVPTPGTLILLASGLIGMMAISRKELKGVLHRIKA